VWERLVALTPAFLVACSLLTLAGAAKVSGRAATRSALAAIGLSVPAALVPFFGMLEVAVGVWAALHPSPLTGVLVAAAYGSFCAFLLVQARADGAAADCGCFGGARARPGGLHLALNATACVFAALVALDPSHGLPWILTRSFLVSFTLVVGTAGAAFGAYLAYTVVPEAWRAYGAGAKT
jgi:hypothetical protein